MLHVLLLFAEKQEQQTLKSRSVELHVLLGAESAETDKHNKFLMYKYVQTPMLHVLFFAKTTNSEKSLVRNRISLIHMLRMTLQKCKCGKANPTHMTLLVSFGLVRKRGNGGNVKSTKRQYAEPPNLVIM